MNEGSKTGQQIGVVRDVRCAVQTEKQLDHRRLARALVLSKLTQDERPGRRGQTLNVCSEFSTVIFCPSESIV